MGAADLCGALSFFPNFGLDLIPIFMNSYGHTRPRYGRSLMQYFVVMIDYGRRGREAIVDPEVTRREVVARVTSGEYKNISFIHEIADACVQDITSDILAEAALPIVEPDEIDLQAARFDHRRDLRKHNAGEDDIADSSDDTIRG